MFVFTLDVPEEVALKHRKYFEDGPIYRVCLDSRDTTADDYEEWGSAGMQLTTINIGEGGGIDDCLQLPNFKNLEWTSNDRAQS